MAKLRKLKLLEKAYDSLYDLNNVMGNIFEETLTKIEQEAKVYGYGFKISPGDKFKLYAITKKEYKTFKEVV